MIPVQNRKKISDNITVLFEEMDGVWLNMQDEHHRKMKKQEMKVFTMYEGWNAEKEKSGRSTLVEKVMLAGMEKVQNSMRKGKPASGRNIMRMRLGSGYWTEMAGVGLRSHTIRMLSFSWTVITYIRKFCVKSAIGEHKVKYAAFSMKRKQKKCWNT